MSARAPLRPPRAEPGGRGARWRRLAPALGATALFSLAVYALGAALHDVSPAEVLARIHALPWTRVAACLAAVGGAYAALVGYDWSALRHIGRQVPASRLALASFCGYALGNTLGFAVLSGGAVRYRIYGPHGISATEIARIAVFCATAFGAGISVVACAALALDPGALATALGAPPAILRGLGVAGLAAAAGLIALRRRSPHALHLGPVRIALPTSRVILAQLGFSLLDTSFAAAALYAVLPGAGVPFVAFVGIFAMATVAGIASHVPGGLGVFEGVMIAGLSGHADGPTLAAALVVYRAAYHLLPLGAAVVLLAANELSTRRRPPTGTGAGGRLATRRPPGPGSASAVRRVAPR